MLKVYDFLCSNHHTFEEFCEAGTEVSRCGCGANAKRIPSATRCALDGSSGDFPGEHMKWVKQHEQAGKKNREADFG